MASKKYNTVVLASSDEELSEVQVILDKLGVDYYLEQEETHYRVFALMTKNQLNTYLNKKRKNAA